MGAAVDAVSIAVWMRWARTQPIIFSREDEEVDRLDVDEERVRGEERRKT